MNIIEAIKSGKRFRRKDYDGAWFLARKDVYDIQPLNLDYNSIVADDWEIESQSETITREQFNKAWRKIVYCHDNEREDMIKELGL